jgi:diguanylate cyclase (GGDEF)-like protein/PAS domain S-box-containing protein
MENLDSTREIVEMKRERTKSELARELKRLHKRIQWLEKAETRHQQEAGRLRISEQRWRCLLQSAPDIILMIDRSGKILYINRTVEGFSIEKTIDRSIYEFILPEYRSLTRRAVRRVFRTGEEVRFETQGAGPGGAPVWYSTRLGPIEQDGRVVAVAQISTDITRQKQAAQVLRESELKYRRLLEGAAEGVLIADLKTKRLIYGNLAMCQMLGYEAEELENMTVADIHPRKDLKHVMAEFEAQALGEKELANDIPCLCKDGKIIYANVNSQQMLFEKRPCLVGFFSNVTRQKAAGEKLKQRNRELTALNTIAKAVGESLNLKKILRAALKETLAILGVKGGAIYLLDSSAGTFTPTIHYGYSKRMLEEVTGFRVGEGLSGHVARTKKALIVADLDKDPRNISPGAARKGWCSYAGVPILSKGEVLGVMILLSGKEGYFTKDHIDLLQRIGDQIGIAVENAQLYCTAREELRHRRDVEHDLQKRTEEIAERIKELNCLYDLSKLVETPGITLEEILRRAVHLLPPAMQYPDVAVAGVTIDGETYRTGNSSGSRWKLSRDVSVHGQRAGAIHVSYRRRVWKQGDEPFLREEGNLLEAIAEHLGRIVERERGRQTLQEKEERYRDLFENANDLIQSVTMDGRFLYVNKTWRETLGYTQSEVEELSLFDIIQPEYLSHCQEIFQKILSGESVDKIETAFRTKDGRKVIVEGSASYQYKDGKLFATRGIFRDVTDRRRMEETLRIEKAHLESLFESAPEAIVMTNNEGVILRINQEFTRMFGYTEYEAVGHPVDDLVALGPSRRKAREITRQVARKKNVSVEAVRRRKDGSPVQVSILGAPIIIDGKQAGIYGIYRDISARKRVEEALRESEERFRVMSAAAQDAIIMIDENGDVNYWNKAAEKMFGYTAGEIKGRNLHYTLAPKRFHQAHRDAFSRFQATGKGTAVGQTLALAALRKDGREIPVELSMSAVKVKDRWNAIGIMRDISERKSTERKLQESSEIISHSPAVVFTWRNEEGWPVEYVSKNVEDLFGYCVEELLSGRVLYAQTIYPDDLSRVAEEVSRFSRDKNRNEFSQEYRIVTKNGEVKWADDRTWIRRDAQGQITRYQGLVLDITERKRAEQALRASRRKIEGLHKTARMLEECQNEEQVYRITVRAAENILSFKMCTLDVVVGKKLMVKAVSSGMPRGGSIESSLNEKSLAAKTYRTGKITRFGHIDAVPEARPTRKSFQSGLSAPVGQIGVFQAVSTEPDAFSKEDAKLLELLLEHTVEAMSRIRLENQLRAQAIRDPLTGAFNRRHFRESIEQEMQRARRSGKAIGFLLIDVDGFKEINDTHGHQTGDWVLRQVVAFLRQHIRSSEMVVRYGGDEFLLVLPEMKKSPDVVKKRLIKALKEWNRTNKTFKFSVHLSIGSIVWQPENDLSIEEILIRADERMYAEKRKRKERKAAVA